ncbi:glycosyltransferase family 4 protein [Tenacibaculum sp. MEBiC06402]|uniref:glycosyltransferase family 4 protein n=1 Tax=unclassified Tenacibaculum TaxID=2635139 RepID=UPI003B9A6F05
MDTKKLHVLFLCGWYPSRVLPNNGDFIQRHAEAVNLHHRVSVLHIITDKQQKVPIEIVSKEINGINTHIAYIKASKNPIVKVSRFFKAFQKIVKQIGKFDIVHLNKLFPFGLFALYLKWKFKTDYIISEHWTGYHQPKTVKFSKTELFLSQIISKRAKYICPVSYDLQKSMENLGLSGKYVPIPNVVDTELFSVKEESTHKEFVILHVSNMLDEHKNVSGIIKTVANFKKVTTQFKLVLIGENSIQYKDLSDSLQISDYVEFIEHIPHEDVVAQMQKADVFVLFSNYENLPCVILESFSCGTPVISTNVGGIAEFFPADFGSLISPNNENELLEALKIHLEKKVHPEKLHEYAQANFSKQVIATKFSELYLSN